MLLHLFNKSAVGTDCFSASRTFQVEMPAVAFVVAVGCAFARVAGISQNASVAYKVFKSSVNGCLGRSESAYYFVSAYASVFRFQKIEQSFALLCFVSFFSVDSNQLLKDFCSKMKLGFKFSCNFTTIV